MIRYTPCLSAGLSVSFDVPLRALEVYGTRISHPAVFVLLFFCPLFLFLNLFFLPVGWIALFRKYRGFWSARLAVPVPPSNPQAAAPATLRCICIAIALLKYLLWLMSLFVLCYNISTGFVFLYSNTCSRVFFASHSNSGNDICC